MTTHALVAPFLVRAADEAVRVSRSSLREDDREAIEASQRGDREAFDRLVERYQRDVYRVCYRYVNNHHDASDLAQEVFLKAYRCLQRWAKLELHGACLAAMPLCVAYRPSRHLVASMLPVQIRREP